MPRKNGNHVKDRSGKRGGGRKGRAPRHSSPIDWERHENPSTVGFEGTAATRPKRSERLHNEFQRHITGFSRYALDLMTEYDFEGAASFVPVRFTGISQAPKKKMEYRKPSIVVSRGGVVVLSGLVDAVNINEIGRGHSPISQIEAPDLDSHTAPRRLNVGLGPVPNGFDQSEFSGAVRDSSLILSRVAFINGNVVPPDLIDLSNMWNTPKPQHFGLGYYYGR